MHNTAFSIHGARRRATRAARAVVALSPVLIASCALSAQQTAPPSTAGGGQAVIERGRALVRSALERDSLPGISVAVGINGRIVWAEGFGWADVEARRPVTPATRFRVASAAKPMTAAAVGLLHQRGLLDPDAPVQTYVPGFPRKAWPVTTRHLMGHLSGIRDYRSQAEYLGERRCEDVAQGLAVFAGDSLMAKPGTRYAYAGYNYALASVAVQRAAGVPYAEFMRREIFAPLGMTSTEPDRAGEPMPERATMYNRAPGLVPAPKDDDSCVLAAGGFLSTPSDLVRFGFGMLKGELLTAETVRMLWTPMRLESGESTGYGFGWMVRSATLVQGAAPSPMYGHGGSAVGASTSFMVFPEQGIVVSVITNVSGAGTPALAGRLAQLFAAGPL